MTGREGFKSALRQTGQILRLSPGDEGSGSSVKESGVRWRWEKTCGAEGEEAGQMGDSLGFFWEESEVSGSMVGVSEGVQKEGRVGFWDWTLLAPTASCLATKKKKKKKKEKKKKKREREGEGEKEKWGLFPCMAYLFSSYRFPRVGYVLF